MQQQYEKLPNYIKNLVPQPNYSQLNLNSLTQDLNNIKNIVNSIKTKTVLNLLKPLYQTYENGYENNNMSSHKNINSNINNNSNNNNSNSNSNNENVKPIILIFCQPSQQLVIQRDKIYPYTPVAYSSWLQSAGAKCIPLPYNINQGSIQFLLQRSHGLLIPGGGSNLYKNFDMKQGQGPVMQGFLKIWRYILKMWAKGIYYPIWGTCLGLQIILLALSGDVKILSNLNSRGHQVQIYSNYQNSQILKKMPINLRLKTQNMKLLNFQHSYGISVKKFLSNPKLTQKLKLVQISKDKDGKWFCSGMQGKNNPIFISQYHPQKQAFQWTKTGEIKHNRDTIQLSQYLAMSFLNLCKKCKPIKQFKNCTQQLFYNFHQYKQIHTPLKMYKVYAIDFKFRQHDKQVRKQIKNIKRSSSIAVKTLIK